MNDRQIILVVAIISIIIVGSIGFWYFMAQHEEQMQEDFMRGYSGEKKLTSYESCMLGQVPDVLPEDRYCSAFDNTIKR